MRVLKQFVVVGVGTLAWELKSLQKERVLLGPAVIQNSPFSFPAHWHNLGPQRCKDCVFPVMTFFILMVRIDYPFDLFKQPFSPCVCFSSLGAAFDFGISTLERSSPSSANRAMISFTGTLAPSGCYCLSSKR